MLPSLLLFARVPEPGRVKTRLAGRLTARGATDLYRAFLEDAARVYLRPSRWESVLCAEPDPSDPRLAALFSDGWRRQAQAPGDLGSRLAGAFEGELRRGVPAAVAVGSDHPALPLRLLDAVFRALAGEARRLSSRPRTAATARSASRPRPPWPRCSGTFPGRRAPFFRKRSRRLESAGVPHSVLEGAYDVDLPEDVDRLQRDLAGRDPNAEDFPAATARALAALAAGTRP